MNQFNSKSLKTWVCYSFLAAAVAFDCSKASAQSYGPEYATPSSFKVTFYQLGFYNATTGDLYPILNSDSGVEVDITNASAGSVLASGAADPPAGIQYNYIYGITKNQFKLKVATAHCATKAVSNTFNGTALTGPVATAVSSNAGELVDTFTGYSNGSGGSYNGPETTTIVPSGTGVTKATAITQQLILKSNPLTPLVATSRAADSVLYLGNLGSFVTPSSYPNKKVTFGFRLTNAAELYCSANNSNWGYGVNNVGYSLYLD